MGVSEPLVVHLGAVERQWLMWSDRLPSELDKITKMPRLLISLTLVLQALASLVSRVE